MQRGRVVVVAGPPASGKSTICRRLAERFGFVHLSLGDILRDEIRKGTELGMQARDYVIRGSLVPDELVIDFVRGRLRQPEITENGIVIDGFPRTAAQAEALVEQMEVKWFFLLKVPEWALMKRRAGRRIDLETGEIYHLTFRPPPLEIESRLVCKAYEGDESSFRARLAAYNSQLRHILPFFDGTVVQVNAMRNIEQVFERIYRYFVTKQQSRVASLDSGPQCVMCFQRPADHLAIPCGHQCACGECLTRVLRTYRACPICRAKTTGIQRVFQCSPGGVAASSNAIGGTARGPRPDMGVLYEHPSTPDYDAWPGDAVQVDASSCSRPWVEIALDEGIPESASGIRNVMVNIAVPDSSARVPTDLCCVVDVSASMGSLVVESDGVRNAHGLSILDIVKHALKTIIHVLGEADRLALVAFNHKAQLLFPLQPMAEDARRTAIGSLERLVPVGETNIWDGLLVGMETLRTETDPFRQKTLFLLTDGQPNVLPPRGHISELIGYKDKHPGFNFQINTFGFGYDSDSELLLKLSQQGLGTYAFIPDAVIVGTVFVNSIANVLSTQVQNATLHLLTRGASRFEGPVAGECDTKEESWGRVVTLGPLQFGQSRQLVVPMRIAAGQEAYLEAILSWRERTELLQASAEGRDRGSSRDALMARLRSEVVSTGFRALRDASSNRGEEAAEAVRALARHLASPQLQRLFSAPDQEAEGGLQALSADVSGRMSKALQGQSRFERWGKHYLRALMRSHQLQQCTNFMDPGLQVYGGDLFKEIRETGDQIFLSLPPPAPTAYNAPWEGSSTTRQQTTVVSPPTMGSYYAGAGGG